MGCLGMPAAPFDSTCCCQYDEPGVKLTPFFWTPEGGRVMWHQSIDKASSYGTIHNTIRTLPSFLLTSSRVKKFQSDRIDADVPLPGGDFCRPVRSPWCRHGNPHYGPRMRMPSAPASRASSRRGRTTQSALRDFIAAVTPVNEALSILPYARRGVGSS